MEKQSEPFIIETVTVYLLEITGGKKKMGKRAVRILCVMMLLLGVAGGFLLLRDEVWSGQEVTGSETPEQNLITVGFSQVGAESDWRTANSISIKQTFSLNKGYNLIFEDAKQVQTNQIRAIRSFIQQDVDYIIFSPVVEDGWDTVLEEAKLADIPVLIIDRQVSVKNENLYTAWVGSDFYLQGQKACKVLAQYAKESGMEEVNIVDIQGTIGSTAQIGRSEALEKAAKTYGWNLLAQESGEYTEARAYEVMAEMLQKFDSINVVYCENDNEAFGAIEAIEDAGKTVGADGDILVISFDATRGGLENTLAGKIFLDVECNPLQGPEAENIIRQLMSGQQVEKKHYLEEQLFTSADGIAPVEIDGTSYPVEQITEELLHAREY